MIPLNRTGEVVEGSNERCSRGLEQYEDQAVGAEVDLKVVEYWGRSGSQDPEVDVVQTAS
jgi:hypothetical protein